MTMTPREVVRRTVRFEYAERIPYSLTEPYGTDFADVMMSPSPDARPRAGVDEWGCVWENIGISSLGEVKEPVLKDWVDWDSLKIPDIRDETRWESLADARDRAGDRFLMASGISLYERVHFIRGLEDTWVDIHTAPAELGRLIDVLVDMNLYAIERYSRAGADGYMWWDDWGLQNRLMISPDSWREIWKPRYARVYRGAREAGLLTFLHSCGDITAILDDLIEIGLDVIQMDQQENMGLDLLGRQFGGRITFWCPVDIQATMVHGSPAAIRAYCRELVAKLGRPNGGFIAKLYPDPAGAGHTQEAIDVMCDEFMALSRQHVRA
ncbi:uroporphyrinogen decarboxylase family protein [Verrucomicrobiota bacterium]